MILRHDGEAQQLFELESRFAKHDAFPADPGRDTEAKMIEFLKAAKDMHHKPLVQNDLYARVRGTNTDEAEPLPDGKENPWTDLWFYSNPVFVHLG